VRVHLPDTSVSIALSPADEYLLSPRLVAQHRASAYAQPCQHRVTMQEGGGPVFDCQRHLAACRGARGHQKKLRAFGHMGFSRLRRSQALPLAAPDISL
jgi:hypothetical protein